MFMILNGLSIMIFFTTLSIWIIASILVQSLPFSKHNQALKRKQKVLWFFIIINLSIASIWTLLVIGTWLSQGWLFVEGIVKTMIPIFLLSNLSILIFTMPRLRSLTIDDKQSLSIETKTKSLHPKLQIPIFAAILASSMNLYFVLFANAVMPNLYEMLAWPLLFLLLLFIPSFFVIKRYEQAVQGKEIPTSLWKSLLKSLPIIGLMVLSVLFIVLVNVWIGVTTTKLPDAYSMMNHDNIDTGKKDKLTDSHHHNVQQHHSDSMKLDVKHLRGNIQAPADKKFTLVAEQKMVTLQSGKKIKAWTYNGKIAPALRVREGEMIEVKLINRDISKGVTIHWHGYNVPNAMDGVPGMTQNIVQPGGTFVYKFRANQVGTYWFHSHQQASEQVEKGLFGILIVEPKKEIYPYDHELTVITHKWNTNQGTTMAFGNYDQKQIKQIQPGKKVRIRIINASNLSRIYLLNGTNFQVTSIDGVPIQNPEQLSSATSVQIAAGGRYDLTFTMPKTAVHFGMNNSDSEPGLKSPEILFVTKQKQKSPTIETVSKQFDPTQYGTGIKNELTTTTTFDREFNMIIGNKFGFYNGSFNYLWTINGEVFPNTPTFLVKQGEKVKITFINRSFNEHPMHLHGHHMLVITKNGKKVKTPWLTDTLNVQMGESYEVAFYTDNPGMWMDHCHNLDHAKVGMTMHLMYDNVQSSYEVGTKSGNIPD